MTKTTNREVWEAFDAMTPLVNRGWKKSSVALALAKTFRRLRVLREEIDQTRTSLLNEYAARAEDGGFAKEPDGMVRLKSPVEFNAEWRELLLKETDVEIFPVKLREVDDAKVSLTAFQLEVLTNLGIIEDGAARKKGDKEE